jgi:REP element-mobilizing transposase RayT
MNAMKHPESLKYGHFYHIYNRGIDSGDIFREPANYQHFFRLYEQYIMLVADTYAWVMMKNHFHFLVRIKDQNEIGFSDLKPDQPFNAEDRRKLTPTQQFSNLFNAYTRAFNKRYARTGGLFERPFKRIRVDNEMYFRHLIYYIHNNPIHHGFCEAMSDYPWSSYLSIISVRPTKLNREKVIGWFNSKSEFEIFHRNNQNVNAITDYIIE